MRSEPEFGGGLIVCPELEARLPTKLNSQFDGCRELPMEPLFCFLGGLTLMGCGAGLFWMPAPVWPESDSDAPSERNSAARWLKFQRTVRNSNNVLLILAGGAMAATGLVEHGKLWIWLWTAILLALLLCISLAMVDALASLSGYRRSLPQVARRALGNDHEQPII